ncbi:MAG: NAD(P)H-dependent oxidoreductase [Pseudomonadota bacterium]
MTNVLILNGHQPFPFSEGRLTATLVDRARTFFETRGDAVRVVETAKPYDAEAEVQNHLWADLILFQFPVNNMGVPWSMKKYFDEVYIAGMDGRTSDGDGRSSAAPKENYGMGGGLGGQYMLSVTFNAPVEAFDDPDQEFFRGKSVDDLLYPQHQIARFIGLEARPTFAAYDVMKNPEIESDFQRFDAHLASVFGAAAEAA